MENSDCSGVIIGRIKRQNSDDEACITTLLNFLSMESNCRVSCIAAMDSDKSYRASICGFDMYVNIISTSEIELHPILELLSGFDVNVEIF